MVDGGAAVVDGGIVVDGGATVVDGEGGGGGCVVVGETPLVVVGAPAVVVLASVVDVPPEVEVGSGAPVEVVAPGSPPVVWSSSPELPLQAAAVINTAKAAASSVLIPRPFRASALSLFQNVCELFISPPSAIGLSLNLGIRELPNRLRRIRGEIR